MCIQHVQHVVYVRTCCCVALGGKGENREVVVATEDFVSALPEHLSFSEVSVYVQCGGC